MDVHPRVLVAPGIDVDAGDAFVADLTDGRTSLSGLSHAFAPPAGFVLHVDAYGILDRTAIHIHGVFRTELSEEIGEIQRRIDVDDARRTVHHELLVLLDRFQGSGIAGPMVDRALSMYPDMGIEQVRLEAHWVGRYVWARKGFEPTQRSRLDLRKALQRYLVRRGFPLPTIRLALATFDGSPLSDVALWDNGERHPNESPDRRAWDPPTLPLGKAFLLSPEVPPWQGVRVLPSSKSSR